MQDNLAYPATTLKNNVAGIKKKLSNLKIQVEAFSADLDKLETRLETFLASAEVYKEKVQREANREVRRLQNELRVLQKTQPVEKIASLKSSPQELRIASTVCVFQSLLRNMCGNNEDFKLLSESFIFPVIYERIMDGAEDAYYLEEIPDSANIIINHGREYIRWIQEECKTYLTDPVSWNQYSEIITDWWRNEGLPLIYGARDETWDIDQPYSYTEMMYWKDNPGDRPLHFPKVFDAQEIYKKNKDLVYESTGTRKFDVQMFTYSGETNEEVAA